MKHILNYRLFESLSNFSEILKGLESNPSEFWNKLQSDSSFSQEVLSQFGSNLNLNWDALESLRENWFAKRGEATITSQSPDAPEWLKKGLAIQSEAHLLQVKSELDKLKQQGKQITQVIAFLPKDAQGEAMQRASTWIFSKA